MAFRAPLRFEQLGLFIDPVCVLDEMAALLVRLSRDVLGAGVCLSAAHVALNHKTSLGGSPQG